MALLQRRLLQNALAVAFVAIGLPAFLGSGLLSALVVIPLAALSIFLVGDLVADCFATLDRGNFMRTIGRCVAIGWGSGIAILFVSLLAMNAMFWSGSLLFPPLRILMDAAALSLAACLLTVGVALMVMRKTASANTAKMVLKLVLVVATLGSLYGCNKAQSEGWFFPTTERITALSLIAAAFFLVNGFALLVVGFNALPNDPLSHHPETRAGSL
jgi:hypothetical protein